MAGRRRVRESLEKLFGVTAHPEKNLIGCSELSSDFKSLYHTAYDNL